MIEILSKFKGFFDNFSGQNTEGVKSVLHRFQLMIKLRILILPNSKPS